MTRFCPKCQTETERNSKNDRCKPCHREGTAKWRAANPDKAKASSAAWNAANPDLCKKYGASWYAANRETRKLSQAAWAKANPEAQRMYNHNRRARKLANVGNLSKGLAKKLFKLQKGKCPCCQKPLGDDYHLDHIVPLALGGSNTDDNIQLLRQQCNSQKHAKHPIDFMQSKGFLL
jgi:hypothetical protein